MGAEVVEYVREQLQNGYDAEEIAAELARQGWAEAEIQEAFAAARQPQRPPVYPPVDVRRHGKEYLLTLLGGVLAFIAGLELTLALPLFSSLGSSTLLGVFAILPAAQVGTLALVVGIGMIISALLMNRALRAGSVLSLVFSILALIGFAGFLPLLGGILGIVASLLGIKASRDTFPSQLAPASGPQQPPAGTAAGPGWDA